MSLSGIATPKIVEIMGVSDQFVSKWKMKTEREGSKAVLLHYKGSKGYLNEEERGNRALTFDFLFWQSIESIAMRAETFSRNHRHHSISLLYSLRNSWKAVD